MEKYLTTREVADLLGVSPARIRQFIQEGRLKSTKHGRDHLISQVDAETFADRGTKKPGRPKKNPCARDRE